MMDVICIGEMLIDFTPGKEAATYVRNPGGAPANVCISMARNGLKTGFLGKLGNDDFGRFLVDTLKKEGVEVLCPSLTNEAVTTLAFVTLYENGERSFTFARKPGADLLLAEEDIKREDLEKTALVHAGSFGMSGEPERSATVRALSMAKDLGKLVSFDVNYRDVIWPDEKTAVAAVQSVLHYVDFLKISEEELDFVGGEANIPRLMKESGISVVMETLGAEGAKYFYNGREGRAAGYQVKAVDATGAGDAFWGGFLSKILLDGVRSPEDLTEETVRAALEYGNASGALCVQRMGGIPALPTGEEIRDWLAKA
ncbi:MAG TPA: carbohydrate kinase [Candidatus Limivivens intestinipullorum]|uniref:Carbohydrate kinase n=1 Tax=Candidatus Limivivens intestinipullorum TaxID=2840858 RepID=A0A9D1EW58_9FIRM|nr:carbohydrate kinase [Candidatus Limivivens intestinipullorum]